MNREQHRAAIARHLAFNRDNILREAREFAARNLCPLADAVKAVEEGYVEGYYDEQADRRMGGYE